MVLRIIFLAVAVLLASAPPARPDSLEILRGRQVAQVKIAGKGLGPEEALKYVDIRPGSRFSLRAVRRSVKLLYHLGLFGQVRVSACAVRVSLEGELEPQTAWPAAFEVSLWAAPQSESSAQPLGGGLDVEVADLSPGDWVVICVEDTGVGIPADDLPRIFERFYKADRARSGGGTGLGLAIAKHIVQAHGGRIWAASAERQGSTFYVALPALTLR